MKVIKVNRKDIPNTSNTPIFDYCRELIKNGEDFDSRLEVYRDNQDFDLVIDNIGYGARLSVKEGPVPRFVKYQPMSKQSGERLRLNRAVKVSGAAVDRFKREG